jgi:hypothetical protein
VISKTSRLFWSSYAGLPPQIKTQARKAFRHFSKNIHHPALSFKELRGHPEVYSVRVSRDFRAVGRRTDDTIVWFWIGSHKEFDKLFS